MAYRKVNNNIFILFLGGIAFALFVIALYPGSDEIDEERNTVNFYRLEFKGQIVSANEYGSYCVFQLKDGRNFYYLIDLTKTHKPLPYLSNVFNKGDSILKLKGNRYFDLKSKSSGKSLRIYTK